MRWLALLVVVPSAAALELDHIWTDLPTEIPVEAFDAYGVAYVEHDGHVAWVAMNDNARAYVLDPLQNVVLGELVTPHPGNRTDWHSRTLNGVAVGDMDRDGLVDLMVLNTGGVLSRFEGPFFERTWSQFAYAPQWVPDFWDAHPWLTPADPAAANHLAHGHAYLADAGMGPWAFVQSDDLPGAFAFDAEGQLMWAVADHDGHAGPWVGELDGRMTAVFATDDGRVIARDAATGERRWEWRATGVTPGSFGVGPARVPQGLFVGARQAVTGADITTQHARYFLLEPRGHELWNTTHPQGNPMLHSRVLSVHVDADGVADLVVLDWNTIGRKPGAWERTGPGRLFALSGADGRLLWSADVDHGSTDHDVPIVRGDEWAALVPHRVAERVGVAAFAIRDGQMLEWVALPDGWDVTRGVSVADLDGDGRLEAVVALARPGVQCVPKVDVGCREGALAVLRTDATVALATGADGHAGPGAQWLPADAAPHDTGTARVPSPWWLILPALVVARRAR